MSPGKILLGLALCLLTTAAASDPATLTSAEAIRELKRAEAARGLPVRLQGVITTSYWPHGLVVQSDSGIWADCPATVKLQPSSAGETNLVPGMIVEVTGRTDPGHYAPLIAAESFRVLGRTNLPPGRPVTLAELQSGVMDCQRCTISGVIQAVEPKDYYGFKSVNFTLAMEGGRLIFSLTTPTPPENLQQWVDAEVTVSGTCLPFFNSRDELVGVRLNSADFSDLHLNRPAPADIFSVPELSEGTLLGFSPKKIFPHRRRMAGTVTLFKPGEFLCLQQGARGVRVQTRQTDPLVPGDRVEVSGFPELEHFYGQMREAVYRKIGSGAQPAPVEVTHGQIVEAESQGGMSSEDFDSRLVTLHGPIVSLESGPDGRFQFYLNCGGALVLCGLPADQAAKLTKPLRVGDETRVTGVCSITFAISRPVTWFTKPVSVQLLLRSPADIQVIRPAPWWTAQRLLALAGSIGVALALALAWVVLLGRQVRRKAKQIVKEVQARHDAKIEFDATLRERERLAADLHDNAEQAMTGLALQLEITEALKEEDPSRSGKHLSLARQILARSREDLRRSVWNLRSQALEGRSLADALRDIADAQAGDRPVKIDVETEGEEVPLSDVVAGNLLLLAQEALTNAVKHAQPAHIRVRLVGSKAALQLAIRDDGCGFTPENSAGPAQGHFGLQGMRERAKRLGGTFTLQSAPGQGTVITVDVPLKTVVDFWEP